MGVHLFSIDKLVNRVMPTLLILQTGDSMIPMWYRGKYSIYIQYCMVQELRLAFLLPRQLPRQAAVPEAAHHRWQDLQERLPPPLHREHGLLRIHAWRSQQLPSESDWTTVNTEGVRCCMTVHHLPAVQAVCDSVVWLWAQQNPTVHSYCAYFQNANDAYIYFITYHHCNCCQCRRKMQQHCKSHVSFLLSASRSD